MTKPRKNVSLDMKTYDKLRKMAFKRSIPISKLIATFVEQKHVVPSCAIENSPLMEI